MSWTIRSSEELADILTRLEVRVLAAGPCAGMIDARLMADVILSQLSRSEGKDGQREIILLPGERLLSTGVIDGSRAEPDIPRFGADENDMDEEQA